MAAVRSELGLLPGDLLLSMIAEFNPGKRHCDAIRAFAMLADKNAHLAFAGDGPLRKSMTSLAQALGVEDRIHFLGKRKDIPALIRASVVTLLPSEREGLARCVMESLCLEVPVIGADTRGVRDLVDPGCGWLTPVGNPAVLAKNMDYVLHHPAEAAAKGRNGRQKMSGYDLAHIIRLHEELYNRVLTDRDLRAGSS